MASRNVERLPGASHSTDVRARAAH